MNSPSMPPSPQSLLNALRAFIASDAQLQIIRSVRAAPSSPTSIPPLKSLYVLDSSFNPPTLAHLRICTSALRDDRQSSGQRQRLLLLLATQNADKPAKPAVFEQRLSMMCLFAEHLQRAVSKEREEQNVADAGPVEVDIGVTKLPIFVDKVKEIAGCQEYQGDEEVEQVHLIGFDTLVRLLDTRYYPPEHTLKPLEALFGRHRVRATRRLDDKWGGRREQDDYVAAIAQGKREHEGGKREWAKKIELVEGRKEGEEAVSSTKVREAIANGDKSALERLVPCSIANWILDFGLYKIDAPKGEGS